VELSHEEYQSLGLAKGGEYYVCPKRFALSEYSI
jgi:hypothetical protein